MKFKDTDNFMDLLLFLCVGCALARKKLRRRETGFSQAGSTISEHFTP